MGVCGDVQDLCLWLHSTPLSSSCLCPDRAGSGRCLAGGSGLFLIYTSHPGDRKSFTESNGFDVLGDKPQVCWQEGRF